MLNTVGQLALVPLLLKCWGNQMYGEWLALSAAVAYLATLDFGMQTYMLNRLNQCYARGEYAEYRRVLHSGLLFSIAVPSAVVLVAVPLLICVPFEQWLRLRATLHETAVWSAVFLMLQTAYAIPHGLLVGIYRSIGEYARGQMFLNGRILITLLATGAALLLGGGMRSVALAQLSGLLVTAFFAWRDLARRHREVEIGTKYADLGLALRFLGPSSFFLGMQMVSALVIQGSTILVSTLFGAAAVVVFVTLRTVSGLLRQACSTLHNAVWPEFTMAEAQGRLELLRAMHLFTAKSVLVFAIWAAVFLMIMGGPLIGFWTRNRVTYDESLMMAFLALAVVQSVWLTSSILLSACNRQKFVFACTAVSGLLGLMLGVLLSRRLGLTGLVAGIAAADALVCGIGLPWIACRIIGERPGHFLAELTLRGLALFLLVWEASRLSLPFVQAATPSEFARLVTAGVMTGVFSLAAGHMVALNREERRRFTALLASKLSRVKCPQLS